MERASADQIIFLGDFFDAYHDDPFKNQAMAYRLNELAKDPKVVLLYGNHDLHYLFRNDFVKCSGFSPEKWEAINPNLESRTIDKFKWFETIADGKILLSHAGIHPNHWKRQNINPKNRDDVLEFLAEEAENASDCLRGNKDHWFYRAGFARGGKQKFGGIVWLDANKFTPNKHIGQIFGHTYQPEHPKWFNDDNICLDTNLNHYAVYDDGLENPHIDVLSTWLGGSSH